MSRSSPTGDPSGVANTAQRHQDSGPSLVRPLRILHVLGQREDAGGILTVVRNLQSAMPVLEVEHVVYVHQSYRETRTPALQYRFGRGCIDEHPNAFILLVRSVAAALELMRLLRREPFALVHGHFRGILPAITALASMGRNVVFTNHSYASRPRLYQAIAAHPRMHTVLLTRNMAAHYGLNPEKPNVSLIPDCCSDRFFDNPLPSAPLPPAGKQLRLVGLGSILRWKKWHLILEALCLLPKHRSTQIVFDHWGPVVGLEESRRYMEELKAMRIQFGLQETVHFHGPTNEIETSLRQAHWFVLPSTNEPCSVALSEAMASGLPALVSASGGNVDLVDNGQTGLWFLPDDPSSLARCLAEMLDGVHRMAPPVEIREKARPRSASIVASMYGSLYGRVAQPQNKLSGRNIPGA